VMTPPHSVFGEIDSKILAQDAIRTLKVAVVSHHATFGNLHILITPAEGTLMWKWVITRVKGGILQKEGVSESREMAMHDAAERLNASNLKWSEIHI
jgi:hypothetical protein